MSIERQRRLRELLGSRASIATAPGCYDAISARVVEQAGFPVAYMSGLCVAASLGYPDVGIVGMGEMVERAAVIARAIDIPLLADADTGYGGASNIAETVRAFERVGVAGIHLEDQANPKKCAALPGKSLVSVAEMVARIKVALEARSSKEFVVIGRTDAYASYGLDEAIQRAQAYEQAGADATMIMSIARDEDMQRVTSSLKKPTVVLMAEKLRPLIAAPRLRALGYPLVIYPLTLLMASVQASSDVAERLHSEGTTETLLDRIAPLEEINELLNMAATVRTEAAFQQLLS